MVSLIYSTTSTEKEAKDIARTLVEKKLVACVNIIPKIVSIYRWQGKIGEEFESVLIAKTTDKNIDETIATINLLHSYEVPDIIVLPIKTGLASYLSYIETETK
jgi:periplasmic divalent cation tolerance protein